MSTGEGSSGSPGWPVHRPWGRRARWSERDDDALRDAVDARGAVVVGCDGSIENDAAIRFAVKESIARGTSLVVVCTYRAPIDPDLDDYDTPKEVLRANAIQLAESSLVRALGGPAMVPEHHTVTGQGLPSRLLLERFGQAGLIVIGTHRRSLLNRAFNGRGTGRRLIRRTNVPVIVVPPDA